MRGAARGGFLGNRQFCGQAFERFVQAQRFVRGRLPIAGRFEPGRMECIDGPLCPPLAFRGAIANAVCHRDYPSGGRSIGVVLYDDRREVTSSGTLHLGSTRQVRFASHEPRFWNPLIARVFFRRGIIETWGSGRARWLRGPRRRGFQGPRPGHTGPGSRPVLAAAPPCASAATSPPCPRLPVMQCGS